MKEMFKGLGDFLVGLASLILICGPVVLFVRGVSWILEQTLPLDAIGTPSRYALPLSIVVTCCSVLVVIWVWEKRLLKQPGGKEISQMHAAERILHREKEVNRNRGWLCLLAAFVVFLVALDLNHMQQLALCSMAAIVTWPITAIKRIKQRPGMVALMVGGALLLYWGGYSLWLGITHVGRGVLLVGSFETDLYDEVVSEHQYKREHYVQAVMFFVFGGGILWGVIENWKQRNEREKWWEQAISNPEWRLPPEHWADDFRQWIEENHPNILQAPSNPENWFKTGEQFYFGEGVTKDVVEAAKWYRKAAEQNFAIAQHNLGLCYEKGHGVQQDFPEAYKLYKLAAEQNSEKAVSGLKRIVTRMSDMEIAEGERRVGEFLNKKRT